MTTIYVVDADARGVDTVKDPRVVPKDSTAKKELKKRMLTNLYNLRPAWLANARANSMLPSSREA